MVDSGEKTGRHGWRPQPGGAAPWLAGALLATVALCCPGCGVPGGFAWGFRPDAPGQIGRAEALRVAVVLAEGNFSPSSAPSTPPQWRREALERIYTGLTKLGYQVVWDRARSRRGFNYFLAQRLGQERIGQLGTLPDEDEPATARSPAASAAEMDYPIVKINLSYTPSRGGFRCTGLLTVAVPRPSAQTQASSQPVWVGGGTIIPYARAECIASARWEFQSDRIDVARGAKDALAAFWVLRKGVDPGSGAVIQVLMGLP